jgi:hypothetical protein
MAILAALSRDRPYLSLKIEFAWPHASYFTNPLASRQTEVDDLSDIRPDFGKPMPYGPNLIIG